MESKLPVELDQSINYRQKVMADSEYKFTKVIQNTGGEDVSITNSQLTSTFELPAVAYNLSKSYINFTQTIPHNDDTKFAHAYRDTPPFARLELVTRGGQYLMDITNYSNIYQTFGQRTKMIDDFQGDDDAVLIKQNLANLGATITVPAIPATPSVPAGDPVPEIPEVPAAVVNVAYANPTLALPEIQKFKTGIAATQAAGTGVVGDVVTQWRISGEQLYNCVMSLDKTVLFNEVLNLRISWNSSAGHGFWTDTAPVNGTPAEIPAGSPILIGNLAVYLAQESNPMVLNDLVREVSSSGMSVLIPYTHAYKTNLTGGSHAVSIRLSRGHGQSLERVYTGFNTGAEALNTRYDAVLAGQFQSFYTLLDSKRMQEFDISVPNKDYAWMKTQEKKDRVVSLALSNDDTNFAHSDSWCSGLECAKHQKNGGLDLSVERKYDLYATRDGGVAGTAVNYYTAAVCQKQLMISPAGVQVM